MEDFTEFEQRTAYFNGDAIHAMKKGIEHSRPHPGLKHGPDARHVRFPPAPKLNLLGHLDSSKATDSERRGRNSFSARPSVPPAICSASTSTTRCTTCTSSGSRRRRVTDRSKKLLLRGIKSPLHTRRPLSDAGGLGGILQSGAELKLNGQEKTDLVWPLCGACSATPRPLLRSARDGSRQFTRM